MQTDRARQLRAVPTLLAVAYALVLLGILMALPALKQGSSLAQALHIFVSGRFWTHVGVPFLVLCAAIVLVAPALHRWLVGGSRTGGQMNWKRAKAAYTLMGLIFLALTAAMMIVYVVAAGETVNWDKLAVLIVLWVSYAVLVIARWFAKIGDDVVGGFEKGDLSRYYDERHTQISGASAVGALKCSIILVLFGGALYDLVITRMWPVRSVVEAVLIGVIWFVSYRRWDKRL